MLLLEELILVSTKVRKVSKVVEFYHSVMQRVLQHDFGSSVAKVLSTTTRNKGKK